MQKLHKLVIDNLTIIEKFNYIKIEKSREDLDFQKKLHTFIFSISNSFEKFQMNVAVAKIHEMHTFLSNYQYKNDDEALNLVSGIRTIIILIHPMIPHLSEELWSLIGNKNCIYNHSWPKVNKDYLVKDKLIVIVQVNGKKRGELEVETDLSKDEILNKALELESVKKQKGLNDFKKIIYIKNKIINLVI